MSKVSKQGQLLQKRKKTQQGQSVDELRHQIAKHNELDIQPEEVVAMTDDLVQHQSALFEPYRAFGYYTSDIPFCIFKSDQDILIASSVGGHAFYVYNTAKLNLVYMSRFIQNKITWLEASPEGFIYTALDDNSIVQWKKMHRVQQYIGHTKPIIKFILASELIFSLAEDGEFIIFNIRSGAIVKRKVFEHAFDVMMHPTTYINKLLFACDNKMELWNIIEDEKVYDFKNIIQGKENSQIKFITQSPVIHTAAVGFSDGEILITNLFYDEVLFRFQQTEGSVQALSFSTDTSMGHSLLASISNDQQGGSNIVLWDLNKQRIYSVIQMAHGGRQITDLHFMPNEPILISSSEDDNSIKMWFFEKGMTQPRLLKERSGHAEAPHRIRFYGGKEDPVNQGARNLISCAADGTLRDISLLNEFQSMNFSQKNLNKSELRRDEGDHGLGSIKQFAFSEFRERDWQNILTCHERAKAPYMWSYANHVMSKVPVENAVKLKATSVCVSQCGNFGLVGYENGQIYKFNIQSGKDRGIFTTRPGDVRPIHTAEITGLGIDSLNRYLVSSSLDSTVNQWDFYRKELIRTYTCDYPVDNLIYNRLNDLIALSTSDLTLTILNARNDLKKVREFQNAAENKITDICFSQPDSKWVMCSSLDKSIRVWDILTGSLVDWVQFQRAPMSIDFAPSGEFLATSHVGSKAVYLWSNKTFFQNIVIQKVPRVATQIELPTLSTTEQVKESHKDFYGKNQELQKNGVQQDMTQSLIQNKFNEIKDIEVKIKDQKSDFIKLSTQPYSKWQAIFNLEKIKERNKPLLPKKNLPKAPFFLFDLEKVLNENDATTDLIKEQFFSAKQKKDNVQENPSSLEKHGFNRKLKSQLSPAQLDYEKINEYLKTLTPSGIELEFLSLATFEIVGKDDGIDSNPNQYVASMLDFFLWQIKLKLDTDFIQALLNCFLKTHYDIIKEDEELINKIKSIMKQNEMGFSELENLINNNICMVSQFTGIQLH